MEPIEGEKAVPPPEVAVVPTDTLRLDWLIQNAIISWRDKHDEVWMVGRLLPLRNVREWIDEAMKEQSNA